MIGARGCHFAGACLLRERYSRPYLMEDLMLNHELRQGEILALNPEGPLEAAGFTAAANLVDAYPSSHETLRGMLIHAKSFPGWKDFDAMLAHLKFVKEHHKRIEKERPGQQDCSRAWPCPEGARATENAPASPRYSI